MNAIEQFFSQMKHYLKLYKSKNFEELKLNLKKSIKNINKEHYENYFIYAIIKNIILIKLVGNQQNTENLKFTKIKNRHLKYAPL